MRGVMENKIYTIGQSTLQYEEFFNMLRMIGVSKIVDVRTSPYSKHAPQWNREKVKEAAKAYKFGYSYAGDVLGVLSDVGRDLRVQAMKRVLENNNNNTVLMCTEKDHRKCHRNLVLEPIIADIEPNMTVVHIVEGMEYINAFFGMFT